MQYTGLKDSQVVDEYFGDIVIAHFDFGFIDEWDLCVIEDGSSAVLYKGLTTGQIRYFWDMPEHYIIGNIYENKDLLK